MELIAQARTPGHRSPERDSNRETRTATSDHIQHSTRRRNSIPLPHPLTAAALESEIQWQSPLRAPVALRLPSQTCR